MANSDDMRGHNSRRHDDDDDTVGSADKELLSFIERVERLEEEKSTVQDDIKDVYGEAKSRGYDTKAMRAIVKMRKKDPNERAEEQAILDTYLLALGMI